MSAQAHARILCVDGHPASREVMKLLLIGVLGYTDARIVACTSDLLNRLRNVDLMFDAILLDLNTEPLNGYELLSEFRACEQYQHAKIIALTSGSTPADKETIRQAGFDGVMNKPIDPMRFPDFIRRVSQRETVWME